MLRGEAESTAAQLREATRARDGFSRELAARQQQLHEKARLLLPMVMLLPGFPPGPTRRALSIFCSLHHPHPGRMDQRLCPHLPLFNSRLPHDMHCSC